MEQRLEVTATDGAEGAAMGLCLAVLVGAVLLARNPDPPGLHELSVLRC